MIQTIASDTQQYVTNGINRNRGIFNKLDKNKNGTLEKKEFLEFAKSAGLDGEELFKAIDKNGDNKISEAELKEGVNKIKEALAAAAKDNPMRVIADKDVAVIVRKLSRNKDSDSGSTPAAAQTTDQTSLCGELDTDYEKSTLDVYA